MSTRTAEQRESRSDGLSITTLAIASLSSIAAAVFIHKFWQGGAILGAGITPVIVAIVSETLKKPTQRLTAIREERRDRSGVARRTPRGAQVAPPPELERADPFGIWQDQRAKRSWWDRIKGRPLKLALATGLLAFLVGAFALTGAELVFGGAGGGGDRITYLPGKQNKRDDAEKTTTTPTTTEPTRTAPADEPEEPTETVPPQTTPTVPPATTPPATEPPAATTPPPTTPPATPAPEPEQPATPPAG